MQIKNFSAQYLSLSYLYLSPCRSEASEAGCLVLGETGVQLNDE